MYASLHRHDQYSVAGRGNDGSDFPYRAALYAKQLGATALGITNHGVVYGLIDHWEVCKNVGLQPVLGIEAYYQPVVAKPPDKKEKKHLSAEEILEAEYRAEQYHLTLWIKNKTGYQNLMKMLTIASDTEHFYYHPVFTDELLEQYHEGLVLGTGCLGGYIPQHIVKGESALAHLKASFFKSLFGDDFYLEVMPHKHEGQEVVNRMLEVWYDIEEWPIVMTEDAHYTRPEEYESYKLFRAIKNNPVKEDGIVDYTQLYMHSEADMLAKWAELMGSEGYGQKYLDQSQLIANQCHVEFDSTIHLPTLPGIEDQQQELIKLALAGAKEKQKFYVNGDGKKRLLPEYKERLDAEIQTILVRDFTGIMLLNADVAREAKARGIQFQGRGSVCGSLLAYFLGIHTTDSIRYQLPFERFISEDRVDLPDIDTDIEDRRRQEIIDYVCKRYGGNAAQICTFGRLKAQSLCNHLIKHIGIENGDAERFRVAVKTYVEGLDDPVLSRDDMLALPEFVYLEQQYKLVTHFLYLWEQVVFVGKHAAGVVLTTGDYTEKFAIVRVGNGDGISYVSCYNDKDVQKIGCLKLDFLGLKTLSMLVDAERLAGVHYSPVLRNRDEEGQTSVYDDIDIIAPDVMEIFQQRKTLGIFQVERRNPQMYGQKLKPKDILDIAIVSAANRPEPIHEKTIDVLLAARKTGGVLPALFQEDIMERCLSAGLSWSHIAKVLKSLKKYTINDPETEALFVAGMMTKGHSEQLAHEQWHAMRHYLFCKAHAVAYALISARQAYLKKRYPFAFFLGTLQNETSTGKMVCVDGGCIELDEKKGERQVYEIDAARNGIYLLLPHVNGTANYGKVTDTFRDYIQQGLIVLPGIGYTIANQIVEARGDKPYTSVDDYKQRCGLKVSVLENFGALLFHKENPEKHFTQTREFMLRSRQFIGVLLQETQTSL